MTGKKLDFGLMCADPEKRFQIFKDIAENGLLLHSRGGVSRVVCPYCGYQAEVDWTDAMFGQLHKCNKEGRTK